MNSCLSLPWFRLRVGRLSLLMGLTVSILAGSGPAGAGDAAAPVTDQELHQQAERCLRLLRSSVIDFYLPACVDKVNGGYFESLKDGVFAPAGEKFLTLQARQVWTFSALASAGIQKEVAIPAARQGFEFLQRHFLDRRFGGYFAKVSDSGVPTDRRKHAYLNSFALYAFAALHQATGDRRALKAAVDLFQVLETRFHDDVNGGYNEFFTEDWKPVTEVGGGSYVGALNTKTYNTHLHLLESLAELHRVWPDPRVARRLSELLVINTRTVLDPVHHCNLDGWRPDWTRIESPQNLRASYGHDIECVWLVMDAARTLGQRDAVLRSWAVALTGYSLRHGYDREHGGFFYTGPLGQSATDTKKEWWVQAEALVGLLTMYRLTGDPAYYRDFVRTLDFIEKFHVAREGGWWATRNADGSAHSNTSRTSMWQGAYHSGRALLYSSKLLGELAAQHP